MSIMDHSPTTGVVTVIVILIAIAALGALIDQPHCLPLPHFNL